MKNLLRKKIKNDRLNLSSEYLKSADKIIFEKIISLDEYKAAKTIFVYVSKKQEVDTRRIIRSALSEGKTVCVPRCLSDKEMKVYEINSESDLEWGTFNILEPKKSCREIDKKGIDLYIVPCLSCDYNGNRLGYGKGYFDRFLSDVNGIKVALCYGKLMSEVVPVEETDVRMNKVVTEKD